MLELEDLLGYAEELRVDKKAKISLYFITRHLKPGMNRNAKVLDKYDFKLTQAPISQDIAKFFKDTLSNQISSHASKDDVEFKQYTVIDDDLDNKIYTYALNNAISFSTLINENIKADNIPVMDKLNDIQSELWAYCIKVQKNKEFTYSFRRISKGKVTTNEPQDLKPSLRKMLTHIAEKGNHTSLDANEVQSMNEVLKKFQDTEFKINDDGKIVLKTEADGKNFLRLLNDYYKQGMTTKKYYATDSGSIVNPTN